jgi:hypothetical protein
VLSAAMWLVGCMVQAATHVPFLARHYERRTCAGAALVRMWKQARSGLPAHQSMLPAACAEFNPT